MPVDRWLRRRRIRRVGLAVAAMGLAGLLLWSLGGTESGGTVRLRGRVVDVEDAVTLRVRDEAGHERAVRLQMLEAPPGRQAAARRWLAEQLVGREVTLVLRGPDGNGPATPAAAVYREDGPLINERMIDAGYARFAAHAGDPLTAEEAKLADWLSRVEGWARADGRGLWGSRPASGD